MANLKRGIHPGLIYFIQDYRTQQIKIGFTTNLRHRIWSLGVEKDDKVLGVYPGTKDTEGRIHRIFRKHRVHYRGEFFRPHAEIFEWIDRNADIHYKAYLA